MNFLTNRIRSIFSLVTRSLGLQKDAGDDRTAVDARHRAARENSQQIADTLHVENVHADERTIRRIAEAELGGKSSEESRQAYLRGDHPGGLHQGGGGPAAPTGRSRRAQERMDALAELDPVSRS